MVTIDKILKLHFERTGRNSILMDGGIGLTIDMRVRDIACLGLGVYAFWEIVKVEDGGSTRFDRLKLVGAWG
ncbi:predicted protein [Sclerotinia sclerotiorum 1980 UF-70]|nr:predicted protein [Sclerotinia sclerotiorum 1980 UF-70]EDN93141.1 predicted protein [Sclerotinia sclerotiorum 1980 UF-70]